MKLVCRNKELFYKYFGIHVNDICEVKKAFITGYRINTIFFDNSDIYLYFYNEEESNIMIRNLKLNKIII